MHIDLSHLTTKDHVEVLQPAVEIIASKYKKRLPTKRQLQMEIHYYTLKIEQSEHDNHNKAAIISLWMEVVNLKDMYRVGMGNTYTHYERVCEVGRHEKDSIIKLFLNMSGYSWANVFGWIGQSRLSSYRPEIKPFETSCSLYDGIIVEPYHVQPTDGKHDTSSSSSSSSSSEVTKTSYIKEINLSSYGCNGMIFDCLEDIIDLETLCLDYNGTYGGIPPHIQYMTKLIKLSIVGNMISGDIEPMILQNLYMLQHLDLSFNQLTGDIPDIFHHLPQLQYIDLSGNILSGLLPFSIGSLTELKVLKLYSNQICGPIPDTYANLIALSIIDISSNKITHGINILCHCISLEYINLRNNHMSDEIGASMGLLHQLHTLILTKNQLHGIFQPSWCDLRKLTILNISDNQLSGKIPEEICQLSLLRCLCLHNNRFIGPAPKSLIQLKKLQEFKLFTSYPAQTVYVPNRFNRHHFDRIYGYAPSVGIDNVCWEEK